MYPLSTTESMQCRVCLQHTIYYTVQYVLYSKRNYTIQGRNRIAFISFSVMNDMHTMLSHFRNYKAQSFGMILTQMLTIFTCITRPIYQGLVAMLQCGTTVQSDGTFITPFRRTSLPGSLIRITFFLALLTELQYSFILPLNGINVGKFA